MSEGQIRAALVNLVNKIPNSDPTHTFADYVPILRAAIQAGDVRFFNDLYYFFNRLQVMDPVSALDRGENTRHLYDCLNNMQFISKTDFDTNYLPTRGSLNQLYVSKLNKLRDNIAQSHDRYIIFKVLNYLLFTGRYSVYLYLLGITSKSESICDQFRCRETLFNEYKLYIESQEGIGWQRILDIIGYQFMRASSDGNCYYNSIGMLTASPHDLLIYQGIGNTSEQNNFQLRQQIRVRTQLAGFMGSIYDSIGKSGFSIDQYERNARSRGAGANFQSGINNIRFLLYVGSQGFRPISKIGVGVSPEFHGGETEMAFTSLLFQRPILTISVNLPNGDQAGGFDARYFERYAPSGYNSFSEFLADPRVTANQIVDFIVNQSVTSVLTIEQGREMINRGDTMIPPQPAMILIGGQGHWDYAIPNKDVGATLSYRGIGGKTSNRTKKNKSSIRISVRKKTRKITKTTTRNNNSPKNKNKKKTQHFKIVRNGNNTRKKSKQ